MYIGNKWEFQRYLEVKKESAAASSGGGGSVAAARALFQNKSTRGQDSKADSDTLWTTHENTITCIQNAEAGSGGANAKVTRISTSALDGAVVIWEINKLDIDFAALKI